MTETKSQSYYAYTSEQHLVVLSGNHFDKNAGVGAIVHPAIRPHLLNIIQVNPRLLHLSFKKKGGNIHLIGAYAPHAGLPYEEFREPFWDTLEQHLSKIPQPEPVYLTGDFNVRFQTQHKHDQGVTGPYTYGKGSRYIDHNAESPQHDPVRFQRLDHCFTRKQWLNTVCSCKSKLYTGFPSDHYLLVTDFKVKLLARKPHPPKRPRLDFRNVTQTDKDSFNQQFQQAVGLPQTTTPILPIDPKEGTFYTDGSGNSGKCSKRTPAGWGWCFRQDGQWVDAYGPVVTDPDHNAYRGAGVGSNNTGEVTAILEAMLYAIDEGFTGVNILTDSRWALNVISGRWHAKCHKELVRQARALYNSTITKFKLHWVKAHAGHEGNERADQLANRGKASTQRNGTTAQLPILEAPAHSRLEVDDVAQALSTAAKSTFATRTTTRSRPWITDETLKALAEARLAEANQDHNAKHLRNVAKRSARQDRVRWIHNRLVQDNNDAAHGFWKTVRSQRRGFRAKKNHLIVAGQPGPWSQSHQAFRDHLQDKQWAPRAEPALVEELRQRPNLHPTVESDPPFRLQELEEAISKVKNNKAPGPDHNANELFRLLDEDSRVILVNYYNRVWMAGGAPDSWKEALVVSLYKGKGADTDPANYRPISLLNTIYKVFAAMLQARLAIIHDANLRHTQYGFRGPNLHPAIFAFPGLEAGFRLYRPQRHDGGVA